MNQTKHLDELMELLLSIKTKDELKDLLYGILTPREIEEIPTRLQIIKMLRQNIPHHVIAEKLGVGVATVTRGANEIKKNRFKVVK